MPVRKPPPDALPCNYHPLNLGLCGLYLLNETGGVFCNTGNKGLRTPGLVNGNAGWNPGRPCELGLGVRGDGAGYLLDTNPLAANAPLSFLCKFRLASLTSSGVMSIGSTPTSASPLLYLTFQGGQGIRVLLGDAGSYITAVASPNAGQWYTIGGSASSTGSAAQNVYVNGILVATNTQAYGAVTTTNVYLLSGFDGACPADVEFLYLWNRTLTPAEFLTASINPYVLVSPRRTFASKNTAVAQPWGWEDNSQARVPDVIKTFPIQW